MYWEQIMGDISPVGGQTSPSKMGSGSTSDRAVGVSAVPARAGDKVDISPAAQVHSARLLSQIAQLPQIRQEVVDRVRAEIADGAYDSPQRLDAAIDALVAQNPQT